MFGKLNLFLMFLNELKSLFFLYVLPLTVLFNLRSSRLLIVVSNYILILNNETAILQREVLVMKSLHSNMKKKKGNPDSNDEELHVMLYVIKLTII